MPCLLKEVPEFPLRNHQRAAIKMFTGAQCGALYTPTGLGKTRTILSVLALGNVQRIIFVTKKSILLKIEEQVKMWTNYTCQVVSAEHKNAELVSQIIIVNYDILHTVQERFIRYGAEVMILDESHCIKTPSALRTKCAMSISRGVIYEVRGMKKVAVVIGNAIPRRFNLTGTSIAKGFEDLYSQYKFLNDAIMPKYMAAYRAMYCPTTMIRTPDGRKWPKIMGYTNITASQNPAIPALMDRVRPHTFSVKKEDYLDLPPKMYDVVPLASTAAHSGFYRLMQRESCIEVEGFTSLAKVYITRIGKLHQIANGFSIDTKGNYRRFPGPYPKMQWLQEWLPDIIEDDKVVIWTNFVVTGQMVRETLAAMGISFACITAGMSPEEMAEQNNRFQNDPRCRVIASAIKVGNSGIDLFAANWSVYVDCDAAYLDRAQSEDRTYRMGQTKICHYIDLVMAGTVERRILDNLAGKKGLHDLTIEELKSIVEREE